VKKEGTSSSETSIRSTRSKSNEKTNETLGIFTISK
jgi:hypothetical protein